MTKKNIILRIILYIFLSIVGIIYVYPYIWSFVSSFKSKAELIAIPNRFLPAVWHFRDFFNFWNFENFDFTRYFINSFIVTFGAVAVATIISTLAGYGFAKYKFKGNKFLFFMILSAIMIPFTAVVVPLFIMISKMGLANTYIGIILPMSLSSFGIFLIRQFMYSVPDEIIESARIDGAGEFRIFLTIAVPLIRVPIISFVILHTLYAWNELFWPLIVASSTDMRVVPQALGLFVSTYAVDFPKQISAATFSSIPILIFYMLLTRYFIQGVSMTGLKE